MRFPQLRMDGRSSNGTYKITSRDMVQAFRGYNHNLRIGDDESFYTENVSLDLYPVLSQRRSRAKTSITADGGIHANEKLCWIDGQSLYYDGHELTSSLLSSLVGVHRQFANMGGYVVIFPDKIMFNSADYDPSTTPATLPTVKSLASDYSVAAGTGVNYYLSAGNGNRYMGAIDYIQNTEPANPSSGDYWIDTAPSPHLLKQWNSLTGTWYVIPETYVDIESFGGGQRIGDGFSVGDIVQITGGPLDGQEAEVVYKTPLYITVRGIVDGEAFTDRTGLTVARDVPDIDYITECNNRLWGCSTANHEIYACKLGDPTNWRAYQGLSSDAYAATIGSTGPFTGAATLGSNVLFFKEDCLHKVWGSEPSNFQVLEISCRGVQEGSNRSLVVVNDVLYYMSRSCICGYDGSRPVNVSKQLGWERYTNAVAGEIDNKYYVSMQDENGAYHMFVLDTEKGLWTREDSTRAESFVYYDGDLYFTAPETAEGVTSYPVWTVKGSVGTKESDFFWEIESGDIGLDLADQKYVTRIVLRMELLPVSHATLYASYDDGGYEQIDEIAPQSLDSAYIAIKPKRCDHMRIKLLGYGPFRLYSISKTIEQGSEINVRN